MIKENNLLDLGVFCWFCYRRIAGDFGQLPAWFAFKLDHNYLKKQFMFVLVYINLTTWVNNCKISKMYFKKI